MKKIIRLFVILMVITLSVSCKKKDDNKDKIINNMDSNPLTLSITEIEDDYFLGEHPWPSPRQYKVFKQVEGDYSVGNIVDVEYDEITEIEENKQYEVTVKS